jgi:hypothetical protein
MGCDKIRQKAQTTSETAEKKLAAHRQIEPPSQVKQETQSHNASQTQAQTK